MNFKRTFQLKPRAIQYACFRILTDIVNKKWRDYSGALPYQHLDTALKNKKFGDYLVACLEIALRWTRRQITSLIQPGPRNLIIAAKKAKEQESTEASHICFKNRFKASYKLPYKGYVG